MRFMTQQATTGNRLEQIRSVALDHFSRKGYHGTNLREIAADVGIQAGSMYYHFESKEHLLFDVVSVAMDEMAREARRAVDWHASPTEQLRQAARFHVKYHADHQAEARVIHNELDVLSPAYREQLKARRDAYQRVFQGIMEEGIRRGEFQGPMDIKLSVYAVMALGQGVTRWYRPDGRLSSDEIADYYADVVVRSALAKPPTPAAA